MTCAERHVICVAQCVNPAADGTDLAGLLLRLRSLGELAGETNMTDAVGLAALWVVRIAFVGLALTGCVGIGAVGGVPCEMEIVDRSYPEQPSTRVALLFEDAQTAQEGVQACESYAVERTASGRLWRCECREPQDAG